jgi:hypothetical protein
MYVREKFSYFVAIIVFSYFICFPENFNFEQNRLKMLTFDADGDSIVGKGQTQFFFKIMLILSDLILCIKTNSSNTIVVISLQ